MNSQKNKILALGCLLAAIVTGISSSTYTALLFQTLADDGFKWAAVGIGLCVDYGKYAFAAATAILFTREKYLATLAALALTLICIVISIAASQSYDLNHKNKIKNEAVTNSSQFKNQTELFNNKSTEIKSSQEELTELKKNKTKNINDSVAAMIADKESMPKNYTTRRINKQKEIDSKKSEKESEINERIKVLEKSIKDGNITLKNTKDGFKGIDNTIETTEGIYALAKWINPKDPEKTLGKITLFKNVFLEIISVSFGLAFGIFLGKEFTKTGGFGKIKDKIKDRVEKVKEKIDFGNEEKAESEFQSDIPNLKKINKVAEQNILEEKKKVEDSDLKLEIEKIEAGNSIEGICSEDIIKYLDAMFENAKVNKNNELQSIGMAEIRRITEMKAETIRTIKGLLERKEIIKSIVEKGNNRTVIMKTREEIGV